MITENNIKDLKTIVGNLAFKDYKDAYEQSDRYKKGRFTRTGKERKFKGYSLSRETLEAYELLTLATKTVISKNEKEEIKSFLLTIKMTRDYLLIERNKSK